MDGISRSREWDKEILHGVLPMEQLVLAISGREYIIPAITAIYKYIFKEQLPCDTYFDSCYSLYHVSVTKVLHTFDFSVTCKQMNGYQYIVTFQLIKLLFHKLE